MSSTSGECSSGCWRIVYSLTPTERNYDIGNRELLAVKLALEEWRHWLEGARFPFIVWTDHKNLEYIRTAKRINSRQARWALFFGRFRFTISYRPGSKNGKPDALSRVFEAEARPTLPVAIFYPERVVAAVAWGVESKVRTALRDASVPTGCPEGLLFVPESVRTSVLQWGHSSSLACHPGATRTFRLIKQRFWWPSVAQDARRFVSACPICATGKGSNRPPAGLLQPLSVPSRPWSHIAMDFVTGLPLSSGRTVVLTVVDRFSKAVHFIPLPKLPSARETATIVLDHVFRIHGLPVNVVSDRGPQFVSRFWTEFWRLFRDASVLGGSPEKPSLGLARGTRHRRTVTVLSPHFTCVVRESGCLLRTLTSDCPHVNWDPNLLDHLLLPKCLVRCQCGSNCPLSSEGYIRFSMFRRSNPPFAPPFSP
uniref:Gypsy retrotransposon integrase-like protein 1 n=1 Tax=Cyprinus carpio carpio TaxID=630221 RepID=A0A8C1BM78_CYPCA